MIVTLGFVIGAIGGALLARKKNGNRLDMVQHAAVLGVICALVALFLNILILRML
ncbi:hypothetical protein [uncultured Lentibacter sp.]|jgi:uncharacterized membrane protein YgdD (TMEM256/DUF423 family)|uniref:hypothetical protein n=1 Tax=uncultured Lentibacter sp. TaxID=1659309 RepID=UPI00262D78E7|nr:hypothetical protein [uncultured Lentibacter sp.]